PGGPVDRLNLWEGRWPTAPGEIVVNEPPHDRFRPPGGGGTVVLDGRSYTVVGQAHSLSDTADAWMLPEQVAALKPTSAQMLYRFGGDVSTKAAVDADLAAVTAKLPAGALVASQPYLVVKEAVSKDIGVYVPFLATFGVLG